MTVGAEQLATDSTSANGYRNPKNDSSGSAQIYVGITHTPLVTSDLRKQIKRQEVYTSPTL